VLIICCNSSQKCLEYNSDTSSVVFTRKTITFSTDVLHVCKMCNFYEGYQSIFVFFFNVEDVVFYGVSLIYTSLVLLFKDFLEISDQNF